MPSFTRSALLVGALSAFGAAQKTDAPCDDVVIFMARGNNAPYQPDGRTFTYVQTLCSKIAPKSCDYIDVVLDVTLGAPFCPQIEEGRTNGVRQITEFNRKCPNTQIVINGYSEGAEVITDVLGGPGICPGSSPSLDPNSAAGKAVAAALVWGDVQHTPNQPYNVLDGASKGPNPRTGNAVTMLNRWASVLRSYCAAGDPVCAGGNDVQQHLNYFELYTNQATDWTIEMLKKKAPVSSSSATATATATGGSAVSTGGSAIPTGGSAVPTGGSAVPTTGGASPTESGNGNGYEPYPTNGGEAPTSSGAVYQPTSPWTTSAPMPTPSEVVPGACVVVYEFVTVY